MSEDSASRHEAASAAQFQSYIDQQVRLRQASLPTSQREAFSHLLQGLTRALDGAQFLVGTPSIRGFDSDNWRVVQMLCEGLWAALHRTDSEAIAALGPVVRRWHKRWGAPPLAGGVYSVQQKAVALANLVERSKAVGIGGAILEQDGMESPSPEAPPNRFQVAQYLAIELRRVNARLPSPAIDEGVDQETAQARIYERMPLGDHGAQVDRTGEFKGEVFAANAEKTVVAAFKAMGMPPDRADQLFKANLVKRNRNLDKRRKQGRAR